MNLKLSCIALALAGAFCAAHAQGPAPAPAATPSPALPSTPAKKELAAKVVALQMPAIEQLARNVADRPALQTLQAAAQVIQNQVPPERRDALAKSVEAEAKKFADETFAVLRPKIVQLAPGTLGPALEERFTEDELKQVATWLESSASKKLGQFAPEMQNALVQKLVSENAGAIDPKLQSMRQKIQSELLAATASAGAASGASKAPAKAVTPKTK